MQPLHNRYCDESHTPRQACNDALAPPELRVSAPVKEIAPEPEKVVVEAPEDPAVPSAVREAMAIAQMTPPSPYATREWERTAAAVAGVSGEDETPTPDAGSRGGGAVRVLTLAGVVAAMLVFVLRVRRRGSGDES